jgi:hypothetical protein
VRQCERQGSEQSERAAVREDSVTECVREGQCERQGNNGDERRRVRERGAV